MMFFDLEDLNPSRRFYLSKEDEGKSDEERQWIDVRLVPDGITTDLYKSVGIKEESRFEKDKETGMIQRVSWPASSPEQRKQFNEKIWDHSIVGWNLFTKTGDAIQCSTDNKLKLMNGSPSFVSWFEACMKQLRSEVDAYKNEVEKN